MATAADRAAECREILGGARDAFRVVWEEQATARDRKLLLAMAGEPPAAAGMLARRAWGDLPAELRGRIKGGLKKFSVWAERLK